MVNIVLPSSVSVEHIRTNPSDSPGTRVLKAHSHNPFRVRTYKKHARNSFRIRTYEKRPGEGAKLLTGICGTAVR
jgi:hypothetical protein